MTTTEQAEILKDQMYRNPLRSPDAGWCFTNATSIRPVKPVDFIREKLETGFKVKTGFTTTAVRGYHTYYILWK